MFVSAFAAFGSFPARADSLPTDSAQGSFYKGVITLMDDKAKENEGTRDFIFQKKEKKVLSLGSERHIVNRVSPNLASFYHEGAHQG